MSLNSLYLFKNVRITPDYSTVHDLTPQQWRDFLLGQSGSKQSGGELVWSNIGKLNYYRMPDTIRIEGNYDELRQATYGLLEDGMWNEEQPAKTSFKQMFFWVTDVRLVTQRTGDTLEGSQTVFRDVVELQVEPDVWSTYGVGSFELYDSFVERRHMPRWKNIGTEERPVWEPIYYPDAGQGIEGAYRKEDSQDLTKPIKFSQNDDPSDPRFIIVFSLEKTGVAKIYIGIDVKITNGFASVYDDFENKNKIFGAGNILDGSFFTGANITQENVQSVVVVPLLANLKKCLLPSPTGDPFYLYLDKDSPDFKYDFITEHGSNGVAWITLKSDWGMLRLSAMMPDVYTDVNTIGPDHGAASETGEYLDEHEPMMFMSPARVRKVVTAFGGEVFTVPDIAAFKSTFCLKNMFDMNSAITYVFAGNDIEEANAIGALGVLEAATLPIWNSAWKSYEAINKVGDEIAYNAKQMQTVGGGLANAGLSGAGGFLMGGPIGGVLGLAGGLLGTATGAYGNAEELRAKQVTVKNSPCAVKSGGSGLGAYVTGLIDVKYITLKIDDVSLEKLRNMYYWHGYQIRRMFKGTVDLHTRSKFDFIKTNGAKVRGSLSAGAAKQIAAIFDAGVTIYHGEAGYNTIGTGEMKENDEYTKVST